MEYSIEDHYFTLRNGDHFITVFFCWSEYPHIRRCFSEVKTIDDGIKTVEIEFALKKILKFFPRKWWDYLSIEQRKSFRSNVERVISEVNC